MKTNIFDRIKEKKYIEQLKHYNEMNKNYLEVISQLQTKYDEQKSLYEAKIAKLQEKLKKDEDYS